MSELRRKVYQQSVRITAASIYAGSVIAALGILLVASFLNPVAERVLGTSLAHARGSKIGDIFHILSEDTKRPVENPVEKVLAKGCVVRYRKPYRVATPRRSFSTD